MTIPIPTPKSKHPRIPALRSLLPLLGALLFFSGCETVVNVKDTTRTFRTVVIDPGHGGHDRGTYSRWGGAEKSATLETALRLEPKLRAAGFQTVMTRRDDRFIELNQRARISNAQENAIFVSIHFNEAGRDVHGAETYYTSSVSRGLAANIQHAVSMLPGASSRGVKFSRFRVLKFNEYPAVLVECGFLSNPTEGRRCATPEYRERLAGAIAGAIIGFRGPLPQGSVAEAPVGN